MTPTGPKIKSNKKQEDPYFVNNFIHFDIQIWQPLFLANCAIEAEAAHNFENQFSFFFFYFFSIF